MRIEQSLQGIPFPLGDRRRNQIVVDYGGPQLLWRPSPSPTHLRGCLFGGPHQYLYDFRIHFWWNVDNDLSVQWLGSEPQLFHGKQPSFLVQFPKIGMVEWGTLVNLLSYFDLARLSWGTLATMST
jgi:hypothetical protein